MKTRRIQAMKCALALAACALLGIGTACAQMPVQTLVYRATSETPADVQLVRWGRPVGPPYRSYYFAGPRAYYSPYYGGYGGYYTPRYYSRYGYSPYDYGRGYYGSPYGGARVGRFGMVWR
jgi:hypothetical protein